MSEASELLENCRLKSSVIAICHPQVYVCSLSRVLLARWGESSRGFMQISISPRSELHLLKQGDWSFASLCFACDIAVIVVFIAVEARICDDIYCWNIAEYTFEMSCWFWYQKIWIMIGCWYAKHWSLILVSQEGYRFIVAAAFNFHRGLWSDKLMFVFLFLFIDHGIVGRAMKARYQVMQALELKSRLCG